MTDVCVEGHLGMKDIVREVEGQQEKYLEHCVSNTSEAKGFQKQLDMA